MIGSLGGPELFLIFVVGLVVFGPRKLPEIGKTLGRMLGEFKRASADFQRTVEDEVESEKLQKDALTADYVPTEKPALALREAEGSIPAAAAVATRNVDASGETSSGDAPENSKS